MAQSNDAPDNAELLLKKRARRRLVGAVALVLLAVIVLPMLMDHEPRTVAPEIQVRIPSPDGTGFVARVAPGKSTKPTPLPAPGGEQEKPDEATPVAVDPKGAEAATDAAKVELPPTPNAKPITRPEANSATKQEAGKPPAPAAPPVKQAEKPAPPPAAPPDGARAAAMLGGGEDGATAQWIVQLGAYKEPGNVKLLTAKIKEMGIPVYTEKFDSPQGERTRVRAGPFARREAAEQVQAKIKKIISVAGSVAQK